MKYKYFKRVIILLLDSVGVGALPDAKNYGDEEANTLGNLARKLNGLKLPNFEKLGLGNITPILGISPTKNALSAYGKMAEKSPGKDTITGHWEIAGVVLDSPFSTWPNGFSKEIIEEFVKVTGYEILGNKQASGTEIIKELGLEHIRTRKLIIYTSADSVFQIAAHEEIFGLQKLYEVCEKARKILDKYRIARVIARPFIGNDPQTFKRTYNRRDYSMPPPYPTLLDHLQENNIKVIGIGKIKNIFSERGVDISIHTEGNTDGLNKLLKTIDEYEDGLIFINLIDFDMLYGHRNDPEGYANALKEVDLYLPVILDKIGNETLLIITADHGCDPTLLYTTDHTREYVPILVYHKNIRRNIYLGIRETFSDVGQTIADNFFITLKNGVSFLSSII